MTKTFFHSIIFCFFLCIASEGVLAQRNTYVFRHLDASNGLSDNLVKGIAQAPDGRIVIRTQTMLNFYNASTFDFYRQEHGQIYSWDLSGYEGEFVDVHNRVWLKQEHQLQVFDLATDEFVSDVPTILSGYGIRQRLQDVFIDRQKNIWFLTEDNSFAYYENDTGKLVALPKLPSRYADDIVPRAIEKIGDQCWIVYSNGFIRVWDYQSKSVIFEDDRLVGSINPASHRIVLTASPSGGIWFMHHTDLYYCDATTRTWKTITSIFGLSNFFTCMGVQKDGTVWLGTSQSEIRVVSGENQGVMSFLGMPLTTGGTLVNDVSSIYVDDDDGIWIGTLFQGVCYYHASMRKIKLIHTVPNESSITNENVRCFMEEPDGTILIGTINGLYRYHPQTGRMERAYPELRGKLCMWLYRDSKGRIWVPTFLNGIFCIENGRVRQYEESNLSIHADPNPNNGRTIIEDSKGDLWVSVYGGVGRFDPATGAIECLHERHPQVKKFKLGLSFARISEDVLAISAEELFFYNVKTDSLWFPSYRDSINTHGSEFNFVYLDRRGLQWIGVDGLKVWDAKGKRLYTIPVNDDRPNQAVSAILEDGRGNIWVSTMNGISMVGVSADSAGLEFSVTNFGRIDGAGTQAGRFNVGASLRGSDGTMYFGGVHGVNSFHPDKMVYNKSKHKPLLTGFRIFNQPVRPQKEYNGRILFAESFNNTVEVQLKHDENFITLEYSGLNYVNPSKSYFRYRLGNYDQGWTEIQADGLGRISYTGLPPGEYTFQIYAANNDRLWGDEYGEIRIVVRPPIWATAWAKALYGLLFIAGIIGIVQYINGRNREKMIRKQELEAQRQREELDQFKLNFFTNLSHEFRTPLSLIMTPLELLQREVDEPVLKEKLTSIYGHSSNLLSMVNQLLDFRKLEVKGEKLHLAHGDIVEFLEGVYASFKVLADSKRLNFLFEGPEEPIYMFFDKDKLVKVMNNLLSNAFKFTAAGGTVRIRVSNELIDERMHVNITVLDTGCGVPEQDLSSIFDRFTQSERVKSANPVGSGIGLYLVREYVSLHGGKIEVHSKEGEGTVFSVYLPADLSAEGRETIEKSPGVHRDHISPKRKKILIVEDNPEFRRFLSAELGKYYDIIEAADGEKGYELASAEDPDLILTDMMMPRVDGIMLCRMLKGDIQTSHIPIILLTARISDEARMSVYSAGADSYLSKPVVFEILSTRIEQLIEQQEKRKALFHTTIEVTPSSITVNSLDEELVKKALQSVEANIDNTQYSVEDLGRDIGLSRGHLYRKLQSITGQSPADFIRAIRLKRAAQLLRDSELNVAEIAYMVGFNTPKYFNKHFKDMFGVTPTEYRNRSTT